MAESDLQAILHKLRSATAYTTAAPLLSQAKLLLLQLNALTPTPATPASALALAREIFEHGALLSIRSTLADTFVRYVGLLRPFYEAADARDQQQQAGSQNGSSGSSGKKDDDNTSEDRRNRVTGLYLLLLLTQGDYSAFHTELESLQVRWAATRAGSQQHRQQHRMNGHGEPDTRGKLEDNRYLGYPIKLERWLMEGAYDLVWRAMASREVPSEEYSVFSEILTTQIRSEIASCSETAYASLPISSTKNLLFLDSEGAVVQFAASRNWTVRDGRIYFPESGGAQKGEGIGSGDLEELSTMAIEHTLGYARELETIV